MSQLANDRFLKALHRQPVDRTPVWMMRQAGRYLPEYRISRAKAKNFMALCRSPELCCEVALQPLVRYPQLDAAILFSDILTIPEAMGLGLEFLEGEGPVFARTVFTAADVAALPSPCPETELRYVMDAVRTIRATLGNSMPLIGFAGSPFTLATYMVEGRGGSDFGLIKRMRFAAPQVLAALTKKLADCVANYLLAQVHAGADALMIFDTWGGILDVAGYHAYSLNPMRDIVQKLKAAAPHIPVILFTKNGGQYLEAMAETGADALGLDWTTSLSEARRRVGHSVALQGNLDPMALFAPPATIEAEVQRILGAFGQGSGHIFNLGHGILPAVAPEHAAAMLEAVVKHSPAYHSPVPLLTAR